MDSKQTSILCPICGRMLEHSVLTEKQLTQKILQTLESHIKSGALNDVLLIAEIGMKSLQSDKIANQLRDTQYIESTQKGVFDMIETLQQNQAEFLQQIINSDESNRNHLLSEHLNFQEKLTDGFKRDLTEKMDIIKRAEEERTKEYN